jgi:glycosyltransferase involved in cell wall biosynthesis
MKIMLSAYACEPNKGSEPGVGWHWALELAKLGHEVWVLTRANNQSNIEAAWQNADKPAKLHFVYYDLPAWVKRWKKGNRGVHLYYLLWQWGAYRLAKRIHADRHFDRVHHVTFVSVRQPSFMGNLGIPFIFGPVAGGEAAPWRLRWGYGWRGLLLDGLRDVANSLVKFDPLMWRTFAQAEKIWVTSEQTRALVPKRYWHKTGIQLAIASESLEAPLLPRPAFEPGKRFQLLYIGRFVYWKGMHLGLRAFAKLLKNLPHARLTLVGKGPDEQRWRKQANDLGIAGQIDWIPWVRRDKLADLYQTHDIFFFPSLHDSGGMVVLEAMAYGLPVVCMDLGGPGVMVDDSCGKKVSLAQLPQQAVIDDLNNILLQFARKSINYNYLSDGALMKSKTYSWSFKIAEFK